MTWRKKIVYARAAALVLFTLMLFLYVHGRSLTFDDDQDDAKDFTVRCDAVFVFPGKHFDRPEDDGDTVARSFAWSEEFQSGVDVREVNTACDRARISSAATIGLLAVPTAALAAVGLGSRRTRAQRPADKS